MNSRDFLNLADTLLQWPTEAAWRSAVSRAYYAAFHTARELLIQCGFQVPATDSAHTYLAYRLSNCGELQIELAGRKLSSLRHERNRCDYDVIRSRTAYLCSTQVQIARGIIQILDAAQSEPTKTQITSGMKLYERTILKQVTWQP